MVATYLILFLTVRTVALLNTFIFITSGYHLCTHDEAKTRFQRLRRITLYFPDINEHSKNDFEKCNNYFLCLLLIALGSFFVSFL